MYSQNRSDSRLVITRDQESMIKAEDHQLLITGLIMEKVDLTLDRGISVHFHGQRLPATVVKQLFGQLGGALWYLHRQLNICHNDIKMDNVGVIAGKVCLI